MGAFRVLLVDDEPMVTASLQRLLQRRQGWNVDVADGADGALVELAKNDHDVVVTDMRMPGTDGATLLARVKRQHPCAARLVLSGQTDRRTATRTVSLAHQFLAKPCNPRELVQTLDLIRRAQARVPHPVVRAAITSIATLPSPPAAVESLRRLLASPCAVIDLERVIQSDVAMVAKTFQLVNSPFFGHARRLEDLTAALNCLGTDLLRSLVLEADVFCTPSHEAQRDGGVGRPLHDIGALAWESFLRGVDVHGTNCSTADAGGLLLALWGFPEDVVDAVAGKPPPPSVTSTPASSAARSP